MNYKIYDQLPQEAKEIRIKVFMEEQGFKDEFDDLDDLCQHLVVFGNNQPKTACSLIQGNVCLHAQLQAKPFYEKLGFKAYGEIDYDEYCPHTWMKKEM